MHAPRDLPDPTLEPAGDDAVGYVPVSGLAVAALVLGGLSALVVVSPLFLVVPLVAIAVAAAAIRDVSRSGARKAGRLAAIAGLALAAGFSSQAIVAGITARAIAAALKDARQVEVPGSGHALMAEKPDEVLDALRAFL